MTAFPRHHGDIIPADYPPYRHGMLGIERDPRIRPETPCRGDVLVAPSGRTYRVVGWTPDGDALVARCTSDGCRYAVPYLLVRPGPHAGRWRIRDVQPRLI